MQIATNYLSPSVQNEIVLMFSDATKNSLVVIKDVPWYSVIVDTTRWPGRSAQCDEKRKLSWFI